MDRSQKLINPFVSEAKESACVCICIVLLLLFISLWEVCNTMKITVVLLVVGALGLISKNMKRSSAEMSYKISLTNVQKNTTSWYCPYFKKTSIDLNSQIVNRFKISLNIKWVSIYSSAWNPLISLLGESSWRWSLRDRLWHHGKWFWTPVVLIYPLSD